MNKASQFKNILRSVISEPIYELSGRGSFENIVISWLGREDQCDHLSFLALSRGFLRTTAPAFLMEQASFKKGMVPDQEAIGNSLSEIFSNSHKLDGAILSVLSWGRFPISINTNETKISVDLAKLLRLAFGETIYKEMRAVFSCLRSGEKSEILKQIHIDDFQSGANLRKLFEKDAKDVKDWSRNNDALDKFLERMEGFWALAKDGFPNRRYS